MPIPRPVTGVNVETLDKQLVDEKPLMISRQKFQQIGIDVNSCIPGRQYSGLICPSVVVKVGIQTRRAYLFISQRTVQQCGSAFGLNLGGEAVPVPLQM